MKKIYLSVFILCFMLPLSSQGQDSSPAQLQRISFTSQVSQEERDFFLYLPKGYEQDNNNKFPILYFLHGNGERGDGKKDLDWLLMHGPLYEAWVQKRELPFIIIAPQLPMLGMDQKGIDYIDNRDTSTIPKRLVEGVPDRPEEFPTDSPMLGAVQTEDFPGGIITLPVGWDSIEVDVMAILDQVLANYQADPKRVYLTGISYGGFGTWWIASKHPDRFAAIAPIVGWGHPTLMPPIAKAQLPVWAFAGGRDPVVEAKYFYQGINELERLGHQEVRFTIHSDMGHDAWRRIYAGEDLYQWLLNH